MRNLPPPHEEDNTARCTYSALCYLFPGLNYSTLADGIAASDPDILAAEVKFEKVYRRCVLDKHKGNHQVESPNGGQVIMPGDQ
jgi:hypothetical protein